MYRILSRQQSRQHCKPRWSSPSPVAISLVSLNSKFKEFTTQCLFDYCDSDQSYLPTINNIDIQCVFNHSGILCRGCKPGLSLTLGRPLCQYYSNWYVALLVAFAGAGVALVILLITCNITVTEGTVNGFILYANIVRVNHTIFFPPHNF